MCATADLDLSFFVFSSLPRPLCVRGPMRHGLVCQPASCRVSCDAEDGRAEASPALPAATLFAVYLMHVSFFGMDAIPSARACGRANGRPMLSGVMGVASMRASAPQGRHLPREARISHVSPFQGTNLGPRISSTRARRTAPVSVLFTADDNSVATLFKPDETPCRPPSPAGGTDADERHGDPGKRPSRQPRSGFPAAASTPPGGPPCTRHVRPGDKTLAPRHGRSRAGVRTRVMRGTSRASAARREAHETASKPRPDNRRAAAGLPVLFIFPLSIPQRCRGRAARVCLTTRRRRRKGGGGQIASRPVPETGEAKALARPEIGGRAKGPAADSPAEAGLFGRAGLASRSGKTFCLAGSSCACLAGRPATGAA
ncbi:hypothetical protein CDD83_3011 [Cordyceps sp. RAO-2017]|nr:hypothetical protein CDD83_3011 [Cordyceps sp. RAO-2017]